MKMKSTLLLLFCFFGLQAFSQTSAAERANASAQKMGQVLGLNSTQIQQLIPLNENYIVALDEIQSKNPNDTEKKAKLDAGYEEKVAQILTREQMTSFRQKRSNGKYLPVKEGVKKS